MNWQQSFCLILTFFKKEKIRIYYKSRLLVDCTTAIRVIFPSQTCQALFCLQGLSTCHFFCLNHSLHTWLILINLHHYSLTELFPDHFKTNCFPLLFDMILFVCFLALSLSGTILFLALICPYFIFHFPTFLVFSSFISISLLSRI